MEAFSDEWARAFCREINGDEDYRKAGRSWEGPILLRMTGDDAGESRSVVLDLAGGECRGVQGPGADGDKRERIALRATAHTWRRVLDGEVDPILGVMQGKLELEKGTITELVPHASGAKALIRAAARLETTFPEGWIPEEDS